MSFVTRHDVIWCYVITMAHSDKQFQEEIRGYQNWVIWGYVDDNGDVMRDLCKW
jgi:hypothetical protein